MTAPYKTPPWRERGDSQWADYGVNVGHAVYGGIHFHPPASPAARSRRRNGTAHPARVTWHAAVRSALTDFARACGRAAAALAYLRPDEVGMEEV
ncbi:hypothetical protein [Streptomyces sp. 8N616]|uniref:hypothetical protein n=1 Tax=Streptomyces sp. 8N616 TaxID=3457414 RepID=UPI003FD36704